MVFANEPTEGLVRIIGTTRTHAAGGFGGSTESGLFASTEEPIAEPVGVDYFVPLTVEVIDPDAAKDSLSTVKVLLNAGTTNVVEVTCMLSTQYGDFSGEDPEQGNPALRMGRFVGQVKMQLGGEGSPILCLARWEPAADWWDGHGQRGLIQKQRSNPEMSCWMRCST